MADGDFGMDDKKGSRFGYAPVLQAVGKVGYYDDSSRDEEFGLAPDRGQLFAYIATIVSAGGRTYLEIPAGATPLELYNNGAGASGADAGIPGVQTDAESSAGKTGGIVRNGATFVTVGMQVERVPAWTTADGATDVLDARTDADYLNGAGITGPCYGERLHALVEQAAYFLMDVQGGTRKKCEEHLGPISSWISNKPGMSNIPGHFWLFSSDYGSGGQNSDMYMVMKVEQPRTLRVEQNAAVPFLAGTQVVVPFRVRQIGYTLCGEPDGVDACGTGKGPNLSADRVADAAANKVIQKLKEAGIVR